MQASYHTVLQTSLQFMGPWIMIVHNVKEHLTSRKKLQASEIVEISHKIFGSRPVEPVSHSYTSLRENLKITHGKLKPENNK